MSKNFSTINYRGEPTAAALGPVGGVSTSGTARVKACFPQTPVITDEQLIDIFKANVLPVGETKGFMFDSEVYLDYNHPDAPGFTPDADKNLQVGDENIGSHFVPNPTSPGEGSINVTDKPAAPEGFATHSEQFGNGAGSKMAPNELGAALRTQRETFGEALAKGRAIRGS